MGILASNREIYSIGIGCNVEDIKQKWDHAEQHQVAPVLIENPRCQEIIIAGRGAGPARQRRGRAADPDLDARLRQRTLCVVLDVHLQGPRYRPARTSATTAAMVKSPTRLGMNPEIELNQGIHEHWLKYKGARRRRCRWRCCSERRRRSLSPQSQAAEASR